MFKNKSIHLYFIISFSETSFYNFILFKFVQNDSNPILKKIIYLITFFTSKFEIQMPVAIRHLLQIVENVP